MAWLTLVLCGAPSHVAAAGGGLNLFPNWWMVAVNVVVFLLLIIPTNRLLLQPLVNVLHNRERRSQGTLEEAEAVGQEAARLIETVDTRIEAVQVETQRRRAEMLRQTTERERERLAAARAEAATTVESVRSAIREELETARASLRQDAGALAREMATKLLGREL